MFDFDIEKQHNKRKYHVIERIGLLFDFNSFIAIGDDDYDGVIVGYGKIIDEKVYVYAQDFTYMGGTIGRKHGEKIAQIIESAIADKCPVVGIFDSGGARIGEGINALAGCGRIMKANVHASGYIPQISLVLGPCAGAAAYSPALSDFVFAVNTISNMYITGPKVVYEVIGEDCGIEELGGVDVHASITGQIHVLCKSEKECFEKTRELIALLSAHDKNKETINYQSEEMDIDNGLLDKIIPTDENKTYDMKSFVLQLLDQYYFFEIGDRYAKSILTGFGRIAGETIGIIANQPKFNVGVIDCDASDKAARFLRFCDAFSIPVITFVDTPGYLPGIKEEHKGIIKHGAKLLYAYADAMTICLTIIVRKAFGGAYIAMGSKHLGADAVCALPIAQIGVMGSKGAISILYKRKINDIMDEEALKQFCDQKMNEYKKILSAEEGIKQGFIDEIVEIKNIRKWVIRMLKVHSSVEKVKRMKKKHGSVFF